MVNQSKKMNTPFQTTTFTISFFYTLILFTLLKYNYDFYFQPIPEYITRNLPPYLKRVWAPFQSNYVDVLERCCSWEEVLNPHNATILWTRSGPQEIIPEDMNLGKGQLYSLIEGTDIMTDKAELHKLLVSINATHFQPDTYTLGVSNNECVNFFRKAEEKPEWVWVTKEPESSQGEGIVINPDVKEMRNEWLVNPEASSENLECVGKRSEHGRRVVQRYIRNPLLLNGKKMEIRTYWVILSLEPFTMYYHDGTVRLTTNDYSEADWKNPLIHITNTRQQKDANPDYKLTEHERKWTVQQLAAYLLLENKIKNDTQWIEQDLRPTLKHIISRVATAALPHLISLKRQPGWDGRFELLGMDVILDTQLKAWLTEIQMGPGISLDKGVKEKVLPVMLEEMTDLILEVDLELRKGRELSVPLKSVRNWQHIPSYNEKNQKKQEF